MKRPSPSGQFCSGLFTHACMLSSAIAKQLRWHQAILTVLRGSAIPRQGLSYVAGLVALPFAGTHKWESDTRKSRVTWRANVPETV